MARPRDAERHEAVLIATRKLLADEGYAALTFSDVAARAGVTRQLLYRWWPDKPSLVAEAVFDGVSDNWPTSYEGPLEADLRRFVTALVEFACRPDVNAGIRGLMSEAESGRDNPALVNLEIGPLEASLAVLAEGAEIREDIDLGLLLSTMRGAVVQHLFADRTPPEVIVNHLTQLMSWALRPS